MVAFAGFGMVLGYLYFAWVCHATGHVHSQKTPLARRSLVALVLRLSVFALVLGVLLHRFGPLAGVAALAGATVARNLMVWAEPKPQGH